MSYRGTLTENERKILTALARGGPLSKREICFRGGMSWATVVKRVNRLEERGFVLNVGTLEQPNVQGKDSAVYDLNPGFPFAIGIDVEYRDTRVVIADLRGTVHFEKRVATPPFSSVEAAARHVAAVIEDTRRHGGVDMERVVGIGVAIPLFLAPADESVFAALQRLLATDCGLPIVVDDVSRAYTLHKERELFSHESFAVISIRSGVGLGISINGRLHRGDTNTSGVISHVVLTPGEGSRCPRCGNRGCLESYLNEEVLANDYRALDAEDGHPDVLLASEGERLAELLRRGFEDDINARAIIDRRADFLAHAISFVILVLNIRRLFIAGHFGDYGSHFVAAVGDALARYLPPFASFRLAYEPLNDRAFAIGAAFLVLRDYCHYEVDVVD